MAKRKIIALMSAGAVVYLGLIMILLFISPVFMLLVLMATILAAAFLWRFHPEKLKFLSVFRRQPPPKQQENYHIEKDVFLSELMLCSRNLQRVARIALDRKCLVIGSEEGCDILLPQSAGISGRHAILRYKEEDKEFYVEDVGSTSGTSLNNARLQKGKEKMLCKGDVLRFGTIEFSVQSAYYQ